MNVVIVEILSAEVRRTVTEPSCVCWRRSICQWSNCLLRLQFTV